MQKQKKGKPSQKAQPSNSNTVQIPLQPYSMFTAMFQTLFLLCLLAVDVKQASASITIAVNYKLLDDNVPCNQVQRDLLASIAQICSDDEVPGHSGADWDEIDGAEVDDRRWLEVDEALPLPEGQNERETQTCQCSTLCLSGASYYCECCGCCAHERRGLSLRASSARNLGWKEDIEECIAEAVVEANLDGIIDTAEIDVVKG